MCDDRTKAKRQKLKKGKFSLDIKKAIKVHVIKHENRLPRGVMESLSLEILQILIDKDTSNPI